MNKEFVLFYFPAPGSQVWILAKIGLIFFQFYQRKIIFFCIQQLLACSACKTVHFSSMLYVKQVKALCSLLNIIWLVLQMTSDPFNLGNS